MTSVFYSVGQDNITDKKIASTISITNGIATFTIAQPENVDVGDRITYNISNIAYISTKQSSTIYNVVAATGGIPPNITNSSVVSIKREFASLSTALIEASDINHLNTTDLVTNNYILNLPCYYDIGADTTPVSIAGYTTSSTNYIYIYTPTSERHDGKYNASKYTLQYTGSNNFVDIINIKIDNVKIDGLQLKYSPLTYQSVYGSAIKIEGPRNNSNLSISNNIIIGDSTHLGISINNNEGAWTGTNIIKIWNNIVYGFTGTLSGTGSGIAHMGGAVFSSYVYNNTISNCTYGTRGQYAILVLKNNITYNNVDNYEGSFSSSSTNNLSGPQQTDAPGLNPRNGPDMFVTFVDETNKDFHLASNDTGARNYGTDLSTDANIPFSTDIDGQTRPSGSWDIGADQSSLCPLIQIKFEVV